MVAILRWSVVVFVVGLVVGPYLGACSEVRHGQFSDDPLTYSHLVVQGIVTDVSPGRMPFEEWMRGVRHHPQGDASLSVVLLTAIHVMRGEYGGTGMEIWTEPESVREVEIGDTVVVALYFRPESAGGFYQLPHGHAIFQKMGPLWREGTERDPKVTFQDIEDRVSQGRLEHVIDISNLIVTGTVVSLRDSVITAKDGQRVGELLEYQVDVDSVKKGSISGQRITFFDARGGYRPVWRSLSLYRPVPGERWYLFLREAEPGYVPSAGVNGMFKVEGPRLVHWGNVTFPYTKRIVDERVMREVNRHD